MTSLADLLEIKQYEGKGYMPLVDYQTWRVAILRFEEDLLPQNIINMQRHLETDEVFVLLNGECILFLGSGDEFVDEIFAVELEPEKIYNVRRACWHNHVLSKDAVVLVVENLDTILENSPRVLLSDDQRNEIQNLVASLWR